MTLRDEAKRSFQYDEDHELMTPTPGETFWLFIARWLPWVFAAMIVVLCLSAWMRKAGWL